MTVASKPPTLFEVFGRVPGVIVPGINEQALTKFTNVLTESGDEVGKIILLRSPRAGYGKTLLLQAISSRMGEDFRFLAVEPSGGGQIDGEVVLESVIRQLSEVLPASGGLTEFDLLARRLLALGLKPLLISGEIPSHDREGALFAIENRPIETFDFHHQQAATAHWTQSNFEILGPRLTAELSELSGASLRGCAYWVDLLFRYATTSPEKVERNRQFAEAIFGDLRAHGTSTEERLESLLALLGLNEPIVLVFDETEGLSNQPEAGLRVAAFMVQLRQACPALTVVLSLNEDIWETGMSPLMPGGLEDRLTEFEVVLGPLSREDGETLLRSRFGDEAELLSARMTWPDPLSARGVLKEASRVAREIAVSGSAISSDDSSSSSSPQVSAAPILGNESGEKCSLGLEKESVKEPEPVQSFEPAEIAIKEEVKPEAVVTPSSDPFAEPGFAASAPAASAATVGGPVDAAQEKVESVAAEAKQTPPSPFEIALDKPESAEAVASTAQTVVSETPVDGGAPSQPDPNEWSAEEALEKISASHQQPELDIPAGGSAFDSVPKPIEQAQQSPFQVSAEDKPVAEIESQKSDPFAAGPLESSGSSPFAVSPASSPAVSGVSSSLQSKPVSPPVTAQASPFAASAQEPAKQEKPAVIPEVNKSVESVASVDAVVAPAQEALSSPAKSENASPFASTPVAASSRTVAPVTAPTQVTAPVTVSAPVTTQPVTSASEGSSTPVITQEPAVTNSPSAAPAQQASSPFVQAAQSTAAATTSGASVAASAAQAPVEAVVNSTAQAVTTAPAAAAVQSPFAAAPTPIKGEGEAQSADDVEALLSQLKQRFGQPKP